MVIKTVEQEHVHAMLSMYTSACTYLIRACIDENTATGVFKIGRTWYTQENLLHLTAIEAQICLNQLLYVAGFAWQATNETSQHSPLPEYRALMREDMFIIETKLRFTNTITKDNELEGKLTLERVRSRGNLTLGYARGNIESCTALIEFAMNSVSRSSART